MITRPTKAKSIKCQWHLVDVKDKILGRISTKIAQLLTGKHKAYFVRHLDCGDYVVVINAKKVKIKGKKEDQKTYTHYSGYPGGLKRKSLKNLRKEKPEKIIRHAVSGMLPKNKLRQKFLNRLFIFANEKHSYQDKF